MIFLLFLRDPELRLACLYPYPVECLMYGFLPDESKLQGPLTGETDQGLVDAGPINDESDETKEIHSRFKSPFKMRSMLRSNILRVDLPSDII
jgi:hypothetical protein